MDQQHTDQARGVLLPFYLVIDVSASMAGKKLQSANAIMPKVVDVLAQNPILTDKVRFGLIDFGSDAHVQLPLCDVLDPNLTLPSLSTRGSTSYAAAFTLLRSEIASNVKQLKADGYLVHRPAVFLLSDGMPTNPETEWRNAFAELTTYDKSTGIGFKEYPNVVPCGVDGADGKILQSLIHPSTGDRQMQMYLMEQGQDPADAISAIAEILLFSVLKSGESAAHGGSGIVLPPKQDMPAGISSFTADDFL
jgi:uncharacterized protein YegL